MLYLEIWCGSYVSSGHCPSVVIIGTTVYPKRTLSSVMLKSHAGTGAGTGAGTDDFASQLHTSKFYFYCSYKQVQ